MSVEDFFYGTWAACFIIFCGWLMAAIGGRVAGMIAILIGGIIYQIRSRSES